MDPNVQRMRGSRGQHCGGGAKAGVEQIHSARSTIELSLIPLTLKCT